jgi:hypothetical protein
MRLFSSVFIGTDYQSYIEKISQTLKGEVRVVRGHDYLLDLYDFSQADHFLANCISSFSAVAVRDRSVREKPTTFWGVIE